MIKNTAFDRRICVGVPADFRRALLALASRRNSSVADIVRDALQRRLLHERVEFEPFPDLGRVRRAAR